MDYLLDKSKAISLKNEVVLDLTLARGLNYYTGTIIEVKALDAEMGSITGGGRYDNLTGIFGMTGVSGVGISFGADRIYDVLTQLNLFPENLTHSTELMFVNFGEKEENYILPLITSLRGSGIRSELYPDAAKMKKQLTYANNNNIPFVARVVENNMKNNMDDRSCWHGHPHPSALSTRTGGGGCTGLDATWTSVLSSSASRQRHGRVAPFRLQDRV